MKLTSIASKLIEAFTFSDSQPSEITLAFVLAVFAPIATCIEIGFMPVYHALLVLAGVYQLYCVARGNLKCRVRAAKITFSLYTTTLVFYITTIGLSTPSHYGWVLLVFASLASLRRIKTEHIHRHGKL